MSITATEAPDAPTLEQMQAALAASTAALEASNKRIEDLEAKAASAELPPATFVAVHYLQLADGTVAEQAGSVPTHVDKGDETTAQLVPVIAAFRKE